MMAGTSSLEEGMTSAEEGPAKPWKWKKSSLIHRDKIKKLLEHAQKQTEEVIQVHGVRVCCLPEFCIGIGDDGTRVYVGIKKNGYERAVKRLHKDACIAEGVHEMQILKTIHSKNVVKYRFFDDESDKEYVYLILDLCEETLENYVQHESLEHLVTIAPEIIRQVLKGLADLHRNPTPIVHRDLKPSNILRNVHGQWLLADFGISRVLIECNRTYRTNPRGNYDWIAAESYPKKDGSEHDQVRYKKESDIQVAGIVAYYVVTKGEHPFGEEPDRLRNLLDGKPVGLKSLDSLLDPALKDLLSWMLSHDPNDRPSAEEALKHPYLQTAEEKFEMLCKVGNEVENKTGDVNSEVVEQLNSDSTDWRTMIRRDVLQYLCKYFLSGRTSKYGSSWTECLRLMRNVNQHWKVRPLPQPEAFDLVGNPQEYFLKIFPNLPLRVHSIIRSSDWNEQPQRQKYFRNVTKRQVDGTLANVGKAMARNVQNRITLVEEETGLKKKRRVGETSLSREGLSSEKKTSPPWKWENNSLIHHDTIANLLKYGQKNPEAVMEVNGVRVCCLSDFCIGMGSDGTRVYVGLGEDGYERAVKRLPKNTCTYLSKHEMQTLKELSIIRTKNLVRYWFFDHKSDGNYVFLSLDLCEETLESYVNRKGLTNLTRKAPKIIRQVLKGLADLHRNPNPILHRDLKPSNILRNVYGQWLLADFGIGEILTRGEDMTNKSKQIGTFDWRAIESLYKKLGASDVHYRKESDIQVAGMVAYYVVTKGQHPFGEAADRLRNLLDGKPVGLDSLLDPALKDLLAWMLSHDPNDRPSVEEALKHPYLQTAEEKFEMLCKVGSEVEIKTGDVNSDVVRQLNSDRTDWKTLIPADVLEYLRTNFLTGRRPRYGSSWTACLRLMRNVNEHWNDRPRPLQQPDEAFYEVGGPQEYFLKVFPNLPVVVHRIVRSCDWKERPELQKFFSCGSCTRVENQASIYDESLANVGSFSGEDPNFQSHATVTKTENAEPWKWEEISPIHREKFRKLLEHGQEKPEDVKEVKGVRVCRLKKFLIGRGEDGTRVYVGLEEHGHERAVKCVRKDGSAPLAEHEMRILSKIQSKYVVRYWTFDDKSDSEYVFLILDLCEETLEKYVDRKSLKHLTKKAPEIIRQVLKGLADLHQMPTPILHRDLKPPNILRNVYGKWLLADFGISRVLTEDSLTHKCGPGGTRNWIAVESYPKEGESEDSQLVRYKKESDIQVAGMVAYYVATKGKHAFGEEDKRLSNLQAGNPVGLHSLSDPALKDLLSWMLKHNPNDRPSAEEALKHPYLQTAKEKFEMLCKVGNEPEIKRGDVYSDVVRKLNRADRTDWKTMIRADVLQYLSTDFLTGKEYRYGSSWTACLRLIRNVQQHWKDRLNVVAPEEFYEVGDPQEFFLKVFPNLPVVVHRSIRSSDWKERTDLQEYFRSQRVVPQSKRQAQKRHALMEDETGPKRKRRKKGEGLTSERSPRKKRRREES